MFQVENLNLKNKTNIINVSNFLKLFDLDYDLSLTDKTFVIYDKNNNIIATVSCYSNLIKCLAIKQEYQQNNLANSLITTVLYELANKYEEVFVIGKLETKNIFLSFNFKIIYQNDSMIFFTNRYDLFTKYLQYLHQMSINFQKNKKYAAIVMNCNPFTLGHLHLITLASQQCEQVYILPVKEDVSLFPYEIRVQLIKEGTNHLVNVKVLDGSNYLISRAIFPSYFIKSKQEIITNQALLDASIFGKYFVKNLHLTDRFLGDEPLSMTTNIYNEVLAEILPKFNVKVNIVPRLKINGEVISASTVRRLWSQNKIAQLTQLVPVSTLNFLVSQAGKKILQNAPLNKIKKDY